MKKHSNKFDLIDFSKNSLKYLIYKLYRRNKTNSNFEYTWKTKFEKDTLESYWNKKGFDIFLSPLIELINKNNIKNILEIGCASGGILRVISLNCKNIENTYGTDFNVNFINFGKSSCVKEKIDNINLFNLDINAQQIFQLVKEKKIDLVLTQFTMSQLHTAESKIDQILELINMINPNFLYFAEIFNFNNKIKIFKSIHEISYPDRIILDYNYFQKKLPKYDFKLLKENYNNCGIKFSQICCKRNNSQN